MFATGVIGLCFVLRPAVRSVSIPFWKADISGLRHPEAEACYVQPKESRRHQHARRLQTVKTLKKD